MILHTNINPTEGGIIEKDGFIEGWHGGKI